MSMKKYFFSAIFIAVAGSAIWWRSARTIAPNPLNAFAQCLAERGVTMYGADWCPHCQSEKKAFGSAFKYVPYVECPRDPKRCLDLGIQGYPTWIFADGRRLEGEQGLARLSQESGCPLPDNP